MRINRVIGCLLAAATLAIAGAGSAQAHTTHTPTLDRTQGKTVCGRFIDKGNKYTYDYEIPLNYSSRFWREALKNDPYGLRVADKVWSRVWLRLGTVFPLYNFTGQTFVPVLDTGYFQTNDLNTAMNRAGCTRRFWIGGPKDFVGAAALAAGGPHAGRMKVTQLRSNGISFEGVEGPMDGAGINFRVISGANRNFLHVEATGTYEGLALTDKWLRDMMKDMAEGGWRNFARNIENWVN